ncbi:MAG: MFS transporter [Lachnospiraceae bacterium]
MQKISGRKPSNSLGAQMLYGMAEFSGGGAFVIINTFFTVFMTKALGMPAALAAFIPLIGHVWDAVTDPIMGNIVDRSTSRFGAKRFYILVGGLLTSVAFILLWLTIPTDNLAVEFIFYVLMYVLFSTAFTIIMVPYNGLLPDMVEDYAMRSKFSNVRMLWSTFGSMVSGLVPSLMIKDNTDAASYLQVAFLFAILYGVTSLGTFAGTWEKQKEPVKSSLGESFVQAASVFKSRSFRIFVGIYLTGQCGTDFVSGMAVYYVDDVLNGYSKNYMVYLMATMLIAQLIGMLIFGPIMAKTSKRTTILIGAPIRIVAMLLLLFFSYEGADIVPILILTFFVGAGNAATLTSIFAIMADMADVDELMTSVRRPGTVSGMATFARKISSGLSSACIGWLIAAVGYDSSLASQGLRQSAFTQRGIALIYVFVPVILVTGLFILGLRFPIQRHEFEVVQKEIARRRGEDSSVTTEEEKKICERVTGIAYDRLWSRDNMTFRKS